MTTAERISELLIEATNVLNERGWARHVMEDENGRVCAIGAIRVAADGNVVLAHMAMTTLGKHVLPGAAHFMTAVPEWNDTMCSSIEDVILGFKGAAHS